MSVKVKICGVTNEKDAVSATNLGADYLGFNFYSESPRKVSVDTAAHMAGKLPSFVAPVGVFVEHPREDVLHIARKAGVKGVQLHGGQSPDDCRWLSDKLGPDVFVCKVFRVREAGDLEGAGDFKGTCKFFLIDARSEDLPGGTGQRFPWELAVSLKGHGVPVFVAGGLTPENVGEAVKRIQPYAVDVASGVEKSPKRKDYDKMKAFIQTAKKG